MPTGFFDINCNPVTLNDIRYLVDPSIRTNIAGRNTLRAPGYNNVFNTPIFRFEVGGLSDGDVTNPFFNRPELNWGCR